MKRGQNSQGSTGMVSRSWSRRSRRHSQTQCRFSSILPPGKVSERWHKAGGTYLVRNVTQLPDPSIATGDAVIVAPGGAFAILSIGHEGWMIAKRLVDHGIAAFVLKYRLNETPRDDAEFHAFLQRRMAGVLDRDGRPVPLQEPRSTEDALAAVRTVRANAKKWAVNPGRIGLMGFSAGASVAINAAIADGPQDRPSFIAPFYPSLESRVVPPDAPPMFAAIAFDDMHFGKQELGLIETWRSAGRPVEFHGFQSGGHGFGLGRPDTTSALVLDQFLLWMRWRGTD